MAIILLTFLSFAVFNSNDAILDLVWSEKTAANVSSEE